MEINWSAVWQDSRFRWQLILAIAIFIVFPWKADNYFHWIQQRDGTVLSDFVLVNMPSGDVSIPIFSIIYSSVIYLLFRIVHLPRHFLWFFWAFNIETLLRFTSIYWVALNPPIGLIDLHDPLAERFIYGENISITKDLFFSGHTATMVLVCFFLPKPIERKIFAGLTLILVCLLLIQHVHYTIDILVAPVASWMSIQLAKRLIN